MSDIPILFHKTLEQLREIGARGGRAHGRNCRARRKTAPPVAPFSPVSTRLETTAQAIATLDAQFPWLRGAERRGASRR